MAQNITFREWLCQFDPTLAPDPITHSTKSYNIDNFITSRVSNSEEK